MKALILFLLFIIVQNNEGTLKCLVMFIRHGARSPLKTVPALDRLMTWPMGYGRLTPMGERQHYLLGRAFGEQYIEKEGFLSKVYNSSEFMARSTGYERTAVSGDCFLKGFYKDNLEPLNQNQLDNSKIWTPPLNLTDIERIKRELNTSALPFNIPVVPIMSYDQDYDKLLEWHSCPYYETHWYTYFLSDRYKNLKNKHTESITWVRDIFDIHFNESKLDYMFYLVDYLLTAEFHGRLKILTDNKDILKDLAYLNTRLLVEILTINEWMQAIALKEFARFLPEAFDNAITKNSTYKAFGLFTHDMSMIQYLLGLGVKPDDKIFDDIPFTANLVLELREKEGENYVNAIFNGEELFREKLDEFKERLGKIKKLNGTWEEECALRD